MELFTAMRSKRAPTHPGAILREDVIPHLGLPVSVVAKKLNVTRQQLHRVLSEKSGISPEMAHKLGKFCGNGPALWINMQVSFDMWHSLHKLGKKLDDIETVEIKEKEVA